MPKRAAHGAALDQELVVAAGVEPPRVVLGHGRARPLRTGSLGWFRWGRFELEDPEPHCSDDLAGLVDVRAARRHEVARSKGRFLLLGHRLDHTTLGQTVTRSHVARVLLLAV